MYLIYNILEYDFGCYVDLYLDFGYFNIIIGVN